jgi:hypothetical protein
MNQENFNKALFDITTSEGKRLRDVAVKLANMYLNDGVINESFYDRIKAGENFNKLRGFKGKKNMQDLKVDYFNPNEYNVFDAQTDVPSWIVTTDDKPTVMVIAQDALRSKKDKIDFKETPLLINTPFSLQGSEEREIKTGTKASYPYLLSEIAEIGNVYITDIYKLFFEADDSTINTYKFNCKIVNVQILKEEIDLLQPDFILIMGGEAFNIIQLFTIAKSKFTISKNSDLLKLQLADKKCSVFGMVHPSRRTRPNHVKSFIEANKKEHLLNKLRKIEVYAEIVCEKISKALSKNI